MCSCWFIGSLDPGRSRIAGLEVDVDRAPASSLGLFADTPDKRTVTNGSDNQPLKPGTIFAFSTHAHIHTHARTHAMATALVSRARARVECCQNVNGFAGYHHRTNGARIWTLTASVPPFLRSYWGLRRSPSPSHTCSTQPCAYGRACTTTFSSSPGHLTPSTPSCPRSTEL